MPNLEFGEAALRGAFGRCTACAQYIVASVDNLDWSRRIDGTIDGFGRPPEFPPPHAVFKGLAETIPDLTPCEVAIAIEAVRTVL
jgi:hypothetical protein